MEVPDLSKMEEEIMEFFWSKEGLHSFGEVMKYCNDEKKHGWAQTTVHTYLTRLIQKGSLEIERTGYRKFYRAKKSKSKMLEDEICRKASEFSTDEVKGLLVSLTRQAKLTQKDMEELRHMLYEEQ